MIVKQFRLFETNKNKGENYLLFGQHFVKRHNQSELQLKVRPIIIIAMHQIYVGLLRSSSLKYNIHHN